MVSGKELCIVRPEVEAAVTGVVLYCTVLCFSLLHCSGLCSGSYGI